MKRTAGWEGVYLWSWTAIVVSEAESWADIVDCTVTGYAWDGGGGEVLRL